MKIGLYLSKPFIRASVTSSVAFVQIAMNLLDFSFAEM